MSALYAIASAFCFGMVAGICWTVWLANRPQGYQASNGKRYKLTEIA